MLRGCCRRLCSASALSPALQTLRVRQRAELQSLERKLVKLGAEERHTAVLRDSNSTSVFLLCTVGEFNAGKSSLLNALLGASFCRVGVLPTTEAITLLRHPSDATTGTALAASMGDPTQTSVVTVDVPAPWLRDVSVVDTPGTNTLDARHTALTNEFLPRADLLLFVTSAERPFSESEQTFLRAIRSWGKKVVFVVNKADLLANADELAQVTEYVSQHGQLELGEAVPVLPVTAKAALRLKERAAAAGGTEEVALGTPLLAHATDEGEELAAAQWAALETTVLGVIGSDERAAAKLSSQLALALAVLRTYERKQQQLAALVAADNEAISEVRRRLDAWEVDTTAELDAQQARALATPVLIPTNLSPPAAQLSP